MDKVFTAGDSLHGTVSEANQAGLTFLRLDIVGYELLTDSGGTALLLNMGFILISKVFNSAKHWIGCGRAQGTERSIPSSVYIKERKQFFSLYPY